MPAPPPRDSVTFGKRVPPSAASPDRAADSPFGEAPAVRPAAPAVEPRFRADREEPTFSLDYGDLRGDDDERELLKAFFGPRAGVYLDVYDRMGGNPKAVVRTWSWAACFLPLPWLLYRKQWILGAVILVLPIVLNYLIGNLGAGGTFISIFVAIYAKGTYVSTAIGRVRRIAKLEPDLERQLERAERAGGVSIAGGLLGASSWRRSSSPASITA